MFDKNGADYLSTHMKIFLVYFVINRQSMAMQYALSCLVEIFYLFGL